MKVLIFSFHFFQTELMISDSLQLVLGLTVLIIGGDLLVRGSTAIAEKYNISKLIIGLTIVSFGTSAPELLVSFQAAFKNVPEIAIGNVIGSNIANIGLVLALTLMIFPLIVARNTIRFDWPMLFLVSILCYLFSLDLTISSLEGFILFLSLIGYLLFLFKNNRKNKNQDSTSNIQKTINVPIKIGFVIFGLISLFFGSEWFVSSASSIASYLGVSNHIIAITVVAIGTSVPELVTSIVAAFKREADISIGNLVGSNIFNICSVLGLTSIIKPIKVAENVIHWDMIWMLGIAIILLPMMLLRNKINRISGALLLIIYCLYIGSVFVH